MIIICYSIGSLLLKLFPVLIILRTFNFLAHLLSLLLINEALGLIIEASLENVELVLSFVLTALDVIVFFLSFILSHLLFIELVKAGSCLLGATLVVVLLIFDPWVTLIKIFLKLVLRVIDLITPVNFDLGFHL